MLSVSCLPTLWRDSKRKGTTTSLLDRAAYATLIALRPGRCYGGGDDRRGAAQVQDLNRWFEQVANTPAGSAILFLLVFLSRLAIDRWDRKRQAKSPKKKKGTAHG